MKVQGSEKRMQLKVEKHTKQQNPGSAAFCDNWPGNTAGLLL